MGVKDKSPCKDLEAGDTWADCGWSENNNPNSKFHNNLAIHAAGLALTAPFARVDSTEETTASTDQEDPEPEPQEDDHNRSKFSNLKNIRVVGGEEKQGESPRPGRRSPSGSQRLVRETTRRRLVSSEHRF